MNQSPNQLLFRQLSEQLQASSQLWRPLAFYSMQLPWQQNAPELVQCLESLTVEEAEVLQACDETLADFLRPYIPKAFSLNQLCQLPVAPQGALEEYPHGFDREIPGRKWQQLQAFVGAFAAMGIDRRLPVLEWCGGKGHLGRCLCQQFSLSGQSFDINSALVSKGRQLSKHFHLPLQHTCGNALDSSGWQLLSRDQHALALHACGGLHLKLIEQAIDVGTQRLSIAPCCYHLFLDDSSWCDNKNCYLPQSNLARRFDLQLQATDLRTCVQQTVTAPEHDRRLRKKLQAWRLGFDGLQRHLSGLDEYLPVPALANRWAKTSFEEVSRHIAELKNISLPTMSDDQWQYWEAQGEQRLQWVTAFDLVRMAFRRPLELWLALDRVLTLEEAGYQVELSQFCQQSLTPRNILITAEKL